MSKQSFIFTLGLFFLLANGVAAQTNYSSVIATFVSEYNARVSTANAARIEHAPVTLRLNDYNELEALVGNKEQLRIVLQRDNVSDMDYLFPRSIPAAVVVLTNETVVIIDAVDQLHFALSLDEQPALPEISAEPTLVFTGFGLSRHWDSAKGLTID